MWQQTHIASVKQRVGSVFSWCVQNSTCQLQRRAPNSCLLTPSHPTHARTYFFRLPSRSLAVYGCSFTLVCTHPRHQVCFEVVGYLLEELRDADNYEAFKRDVEASNIFIGSLIFIEELAEKVRQWWIQLKVAYWGAGKH
jgi:hypothetical protein